MGILATKGPKQRRIGRKSGFTLIEALVAIFVISLFTSALLPLFTSSDRIVRTAQNREAATRGVASKGVQRTAADSRGRLDRDPDLHSTPEPPESDQHGNGHTHRLWL
jgi:prepilin-type N-terminal cleavage/methylation domain-containing protein